MAPRQLRLKSVMNGQAYTIAHLVHGCTAVALVDVHQEGCFAIVATGGNPSDNVAAGGESICSTVDGVALVGIAFAGLAQLAVAVGLCVVSQSQMWRD